MTSVSFWRRRYITKQFCTHSGASITPSNTDRCLCEVFILANKLFKCVERMKLFVSRPSAATFQLNTKVSKSFSNSLTSKPCIGSTSTDMKFSSAL